MQSMKCGQNCPFQSQKNYGGKPKKAYASAQDAFAGLMLAQAKFGQACSSKGGYKCKGGAFHLSSMSMAQMSAKGLPLDADCLKLFPWK